MGSHRAALEVAMLIANASLIATFSSFQSYGHKTVIE